MKVAVEISLDKTLCCNESATLIDMLLDSAYRKDNECFTAVALAKVNSTINRRRGMDILRVCCRLPSEG